MEQVAAHTATAKRDRAEVDALIAQARSYRPIAPITWQESTEWVDSSTDRWGAPPSGAGIRLARAWTRGNCLKVCIASILGAEIERIPDPARDYTHEPRGWLERYSARLGKQTGYRLEKLSAHACPPGGANQLWIATISEEGDADHCVVARGNFVFHDPAGLYLGMLPPHDRIVDGLLVVPTRRVVPVFSPRGSGSAVVAA